MIKIKKKKFDCELECYKFELENGDTILLPEKELANERECESLSRKSYTPIFSETEYSDEPKEIIGFEPSVTKERFIINYHTGITEEIDADDLHAAKAIAQEGIQYTQENVSIEDAEGNVIVSSTWYGVAPTDDDFVLEEIGNGFYQLWSDELENI